MPTFKDTAGREWSVEITFGTVKRVKALLAIDLMEPQEGTPPLITQLGTDVQKLIDVVWVILKPQADQASVTVDEFIEALGGEASIAATDAFWERWENFFQSRRETHKAAAIRGQREILKKHTEKHRLAIVAAMDQVEKRMEEVDPVKLGQDAFTKAFGNSSTSSPGSSE